MALLGLDDIDTRLRRMRLTLDLRLHHRQYMLVAAALASLTIVGVAAAMMTQL